MKTQLMYKSTETTYKQIPENMKSLVFGNKGAKLFELQDIETINIPRFIVLPTNFCRLYTEDKQKATEYLIGVIKKIVSFFNGSLVSVRSGAPYSMPGLMETVLNVGITVENFTQLRKDIGEIGAFNSLFRLRKMFGEIVLGFDCDINFESTLLKESLRCLKDLYKENGHQTPETLDFGSQLFYCIKAVWESWDGENSQIYRAFNHLINTGTGIVIQEMVFGNTKNGATGVMFSSDIDRAENTIQGEYLSVAQGEDIVSGKVTPKNITNLKTDGIYSRLTGLAFRLEKHYKWPQDIEWTLNEDQRLYTLQTRDAKIPPLSRINFCYKNIKSKNNVPLKHLTLDDFLISCDKLEVENETAFVEGVSASNGIVVGILTFDIEKAKIKTILDSPYIFCAPYATIEVIPALIECGGIITLTGGTTSHAAVIARSLEKPCLIGLKNVVSQVDNLGCISLKDTTTSLTFSEGDFVCLDSTNGRLYKGNGKIIVDIDLREKIKYIWKQIYKTVPNKIVQYDNNKQLYPEMFPKKLFITYNSLPLTLNNIKGRKLFYGIEKPLPFYEKFQGKGEEYLDDVYKYFDNIGARYLEDCSGVVTVSQILELFKKERGYI